MNTYSQILYQVVFSTFARKPAMIKENRDKLYSFIFGIFQRRDTHVYRIGGVEDHIHLVFSLNPDIALSDLVKEIKTASNKFIKNKKIFPKFSGWQKGYGAFTYSIEAKDNLINYVMNQEEHHRVVTWNEELIGLLVEHQIEYEEKYLD